MTAVTSPVDAVAIFLGAMAAWIAVAALALCAGTAAVWRLAWAASEAVAAALAASRAVHTLHRSLQ
ncbi:hypothetical protein [Streptomyces sp. NPDC057253]|uniref:hypothetical protein n=1 Tax=Streptomyces sp. NPDC057253 TaxID=3346069 RepID=UPI00362AC8FB